MTAFVGRDAELAALREASSHAFQGGRVAVVLVEGDPGSGKSRLLAQFLPKLPASSRISLACYEPESRLPLSLGRSLARELDSTTAPRRSDPHARDAGEATGWAGLMESIHQAVSVRSPLAIVVDDVQWCDDESVGLLHYLVRGAVGQEDPLALILAGRPSPTTGSLRTSLRRLLGDRFVHLEVGPLEVGDAVTLIRSLDPTLELEEARERAARAGGWPFWCEFLATAADHRRGADEIVADRLAAVSPDAAAVLSLLVVAARPFESRELAEIQGWTAERAEAAVDELVHAGLVVSRGMAVQLVHDLVRAAVDEQLPGTDEARRALAAWLEERAGEDVDRLLAAAGHRKLLGLPVGAVLERILAAPTRRTVGLNGLHAIVELADEVPPDDPSAIAVAEGVASLAAELGRHSLAMETWTRVAGRIGDAGGRARAWLAACEAAQHLERVEDARDHLVTARRAAPDDDPVLSVELDAADANVSRWLEHDVDRARELTEAALARARSLAASEASPQALEPRLRTAYLQALVLACVDAMQRNAPDEILPLADEIADVAAGADIRASVQARLRSGSALMLAGRLDAAERELTGAWTDARRAFLTDLTLDAGSWLSWTRYLLGRLTEAEEVASECVALADRSAERTRPAILVRQWAAIVEVSRGDHRGALDTLRASVAEDPDAHHRILSRQYLAVLRARLDGENAAGEVLDLLAAADADADAAGCDRCRTELHLAGADALARIGAAERAAAWLRRGTEESRGGVLQQWLGTRAGASLAVASASADAAQRLERAIACADDLGMALEAIWGRLDLGRLLAGSDPERSADVLRDAAAASERAGARTEARLAAHLLRRTGVRTWHRPEPADGDRALAALSPREQEIASLVADGASNLDIAQTLFLSRKTIERHVSNIFVKIGVRNRTELAAWVVARQDRRAPDSPAALENTEEQVSERP